jgi:putative tryptophan/tyrosine transport system substrate-binding protein
LELLK